MSMGKMVTIYVSLLEEGTPTWRPTQAVDLGNGLYKLLSTENYDPEDEIWEFLPDTVVVGRMMPSYDGKELLVAVRQPVSRETMSNAHPNGNLVDINVVLRKKGKRILKQTQAIDLGHGFYKLLPTPDYDVAGDIWEFSPGSVVKTTEEKDENGLNILLAFDQVREDRLADIVSGRG